MKKHVTTFFETHKRRISPALFFGGFVFDLFTLTQVDLFYDNLVLLVHLLIISISIFLLHLGKRDQIFGNFIERLIIIAPYALVFSFGGVLSGYVIFYTKSASLVASWPFLVILYFLFVSSEYVFNKYQQTMFQIGMWFAATLSFFIFFIPVVLRILGPWIFILSNVISVCIGWLFAHALLKAYPPLRNRLATIKTLLITISACFMVLYFTNIIPPIPLSMKEMSVYHGVQRDSKNLLIAKTEITPWYSDLFPVKKINLRPGSALFAYNSIYSPEGIDTQIKHIWEYRDENGEWVEFNTVLYTLTGGRRDGFRWYSFAAPFEGRWRVLSTTTYGQEIGRVVFDVNYVEQTPKLIEKTL